MAVRESLHKLAGSLLPNEDPVLRRTFAGLLLFTLACGGDGAVGPAGPQGPQGPAGPAGPPGALNRADLTGTIGSSGGVAAQLPAAAVAGGKVPVIACYISDTGQTWLAVAQTPSNTSFPACGLTGIGTSTPAIALVNVTVGIATTLSRSGDLTRQAGVTLRSRLTRPLS